MSDADNPVPALVVDKALYKGAPPALRDLEKQARKELRAKARRRYIRTYGRQPNIANDLPGGDAPGG